MISVSYDSHEEIISISRMILDTCLSLFSHILNIIQSYSYINYYMIQFPNNIPIISWWSQDYFPFFLPLSSAGASLNNAPKTSAAQAAQANRAQRRQGAGAAGYVPGGPHVWLGRERWVAIRNILNYTTYTHVYNCVCVNIRLGP